MYFSVQIYFVFEKVFENEDGNCSNPCYTSFEQMETGKKGFPQTSKAFQPLRFSLMLTKVDMSIGVLYFSSYMPKTSENKLAKLRRCANLVHFAKIHLQKIHSQKNALAHFLGFHVWF